MGFYNTDDKPNRKDHRKPGKPNQSCAPRGSCPYCRGNRFYQQIKESDRRGLQNLQEEIDSVIEEE